MYLSSNQVNGPGPDPVFIFRSSDSDVTAMKCFENQGKDIVVSGSINGVVKFWDIITRRPFVELQAGNGSGILYIDMIEENDKKIMITQDRSGKVVFWNANIFECLKAESCWLISGIGFCSISIVKKEEGELLIAYPSDQSDITVREYEVDSDCGILLKSKENRGMVMNLSIYEQHKVLYLVAGYEDGCLLLWNVLDKIALSSLKLYDDPIMAIAFDINTSRLLVSSASDKLHLVNIDQDELSIRQTLDVNFSGCSSMSLRSDGKIVVVGGWDGKIRIFSWKKMKLLAVLKCHTGTVNELCFDKNNNIVAGSQDGRISVWDVYADR